MKAGGFGGGSTKTGLNFEEKADFLTALASVDGYNISDSPGRKIVTFRGSVVAECYRKHDLYKFLASTGVPNWNERVSKRLLPDDALFVISSKTLFIVEIKWQQVAGSVDEKLQTCDFKRRQYEKLFYGTGVRIQYVYLLNDWFRKPEYSDVLSYIEEVACFYFFDRVPMSFFGLPEPNQTSE